jgi:hypothetical protein
LRANHEYSLTTDPGRADPVSDFLLTKKAAHCEYFASAAVMLLRCVDVPARYVTGFYAHESAGSSARTIRQQDAHAWAEAWIDGVGWVTVDATPPAGMPEQISAQAPLWQRAYERVLDALSGVWRALSVRTWIALAAVATGAAGVFWWRRRRAARRKQAASVIPTYTPPAAPLVAVAMQFEELLRKRGMPCPAQTTWGEHLAALGGEEHGPQTAAVRGTRGVDLERARAFLREYTVTRFREPENRKAIAEAVAAFEAMRK